MASQQTQVNGTNEVQASAVAESQASSEYGQSAQGQGSGAAARPHGASSGVSSSEAALQDEQIDQEMTEPNAELSDSPLGVALVADTAMTGGIAEAGPPILQLPRVADMPFEDKLKAMRAFWATGWSNCKDGEYIDAMDTVSKWCLAQVTARDDTAARCHFDGWSSKWDLSYRWTSSKIAPFRRYSRGYTGQVKTPLRSSRTFDVEDVRREAARVQELVDNDFRGWTAHELTQYLRGELFVAVDFLLSANTYSEDDIAEVCEFVKTVIRLIVHWLKKAPELLEKCLPELRRDADLFLVDEDAAVLLCACELMGILQRLFCGCHRALRFYLHFDQEQQSFKEPVTKPFKGDFVQRRTPVDQDVDVDELRGRISARADDLVFGHALNFLDYFAELGGFPALLALLRAGNTRAEEPSSDAEASKVPKELMPLELLADLTGAFLNCGALLSESFAAKFVQDVQEIVTQRLLGMRDKEIKELDKDALPTALQSFRAFLQIAKTEDEIAELIEQIQLSLASRFLKATYLEKRLKGVSDIRQLIERVEARVTLEKQRRMHKYQGQRVDEHTGQSARQLNYVVGVGGQKVRPTQYLDTARLRDWIIKEGVAETLFGEGAHPEIVKRAAPVLRFLSQHGAMSQEIVDSVWRCQQGKHEETVRVVYGLINDVVEDLPLPLLEALFAKIAEVPEAAYTEMYLLFLKEFTSRALEAGESARQYRSMKRRPKQDSSSGGSAVNEDEAMPHEPSIQSRERKIFSNLNEALMQPEAAALTADDRLYGLPVLWNIVQDSYQNGAELASSEILRLALDSLCEVLTQPFARSIRMYYLLACLNNLRSGVSLYASICVAISIIEALEPAGDLDEDELVLSSRRAVELLEEQLGLVDIILKDITHYDQQVKEALKQLARKGRAPPEKVESHIFAGRTGHQVTLEKLLELLEFVVLSSDWAVTVKTTNIDLLWKTFVLSPNFTSDQTIFLQFVNKKRHQSQKQSGELSAYGNKVAQEVALFTADEQKHLFTQILCNPTFVDYKKLSSGLAKCFHTYFRLINREEGHLDHAKRRVEVAAFEQLIGIDSLWSILFESENEKARDDSRELLVDLHLRLAPRYEAAARRQIMQSFIDKSMSILVQASTDTASPAPERKALNVIEALAQFLDRYEGKKPIKPELKSVAMQYSHYQPWTITVVGRKDGGQQQEARMQVSQFESLGSVREKCAALFGLELNEFHLRLKHSVVDPDEDDDRYVKDHGMSPQIFLLPNVAYDKQGHPKYLVAQNQAHFELLFALLAKSSPLLVEPVWELLQKLPVNAKLHQDISQLQGAQEGWNSLLDSRSTHKLLYSLKIIEGLNGQKQGERAGKGQADEQSSNFLGEFKDLSAWKRRFIELGGYRHLLDTLIGLQIEAIDSKLTLRCIESLLAALLDFMQVDQALQDEILAKKEAVVLTCMRYLHLIGLFSLQVERQRGEAVEDIQAKKTQKRLAKQKMRQLQMAGHATNGADARRRGAAAEDEDADDEEDECSEQINQVLHEFAAVRSIVESLFSFMNRFVFSRDRTALRIVEQYPGLEEMVTVTVLQSENYLMRGESGRRIREMLGACSGEAALIPTMTVLLRVLLIKVLPVAASHEGRCAQYFFQVQRVLEDLKASDLEPLQQDLWQLAQSLAADVRARETKEVNTKLEDRVLVGMMTVLRVLMQKFPARKVEIGTRLVPYLLHDCLFEIPHGSGTSANAVSKPKCKSMASRGGALRLLSVLSRDCLDNLRLVLDYIRDFGRRASWRTNKQSDWSITHLDDEKSTTGYVGLKNLGCICYMISLFQQLFMVPGFRSDILAVDDPNHDGQEPDENMFYQLQAIFTGLLKSEKQYVNPKGFCHAFKDWEGQATNVLEQMDVEEFLQMFLDRLETAIKGSPQEKTVQSHFGGKFASEMICKGCPHQYERSEPFLSIGVAVKNKRSLQEGLNAFIQGDMLEGDNAYSCAKCDKKVDTLKRTCVKELPRNLIISLKRFEFDFDRMVRVKVNDYCEFPLELDMLPYTQEGLAHREEAAKRKQEAAERGEEAPEEVEAEALKYPRDYYEFKLKGVVVHTGTADSGHYYSFIREHQQDSERWYEFNDHIVRDFDISELANECFGGDDGFSGQGMMQSGTRSQKWRNAYLLIYERKNQNVVHQEEEEAVGTATRPATNPTVTDQVESMMDEESKSAVAKAPKLSDPEHPIQQKILLENQKYWQNKFLFGDEYFDFVSEVSHYWDTTHITPLQMVNKNADAHIVGFQLRAPADPGALQAEIPRPIDEAFDLRVQHADSPHKVAEASHEVFKFAASFYLTILQRAQHKGLVPKMVNALKAYLNHDPRNGEWLLLELTNWELIKEMLLQPQGREMPKLTCGLIYCAMLTIYDKEKASLASFWNDADKQGRGGATQGAQKHGLGTLGNFILLLFSHLYDLKAFVLNLPHYFQILARFVSLGPEAREFMLRARAVGRCMDFFFDGASPYRALFGDMSDLGPVVTREEPELGLPTALDKKARTYFQQLREKRRKQHLASATPKYKYLMELVSSCVRHLRVGGGTGPTSPYQLDAECQEAPSAFVASQEADIFIPEAKFLKRFIAEAKRNRSAWAVAKAHCHYAYADREQLEELFRTVEAGLNEHDYDGIRPFLCVFEVLLETNGEHFASRRSAWLTRFLETAKANFGYFKWMEVIFEFIFKITSRNAAVRDWFYHNQNTWQCLVEWVSQHPRAPHPAQGAASGVRLFKGRQNLQLAALQHYNDPNGTARNGLGAAYRVRRMQELLSQAVPDLSAEPDTDKIDLQDFKFVAGDVVTVLDRKRDESEQWRVVAVLDELISLQSLDPDQAAKGTVRWQRCDTDKLLLGDTFRLLARTRLRRELHDSRLAQRAEQVRSAAGLGRADADEDMDEDRRGGRTHQRPGQGAGAPANDATGQAAVQPDVSSNDYDSSDEEHGESGH